MKAKDLTGQRFGRLTVIEKQSTDKWGCSTWLCKCDCNGNEKVYSGNNLSRSLTQSCGCYNKEQITKANKKYNTYDLTGEYGIGYTTNGKKFYFDLEDYDKIKEHCWHITDGYVVTNIKGKKHDMHRLVLSYNGELQIDHNNRKRNDNRKKNLRIATNQENSFNKDKYITNTTGFKGVYWNKKLGKWCSQITVNYKNIHLGYFEDINDAIEAREEASKKYFGEFNIKD